MRDPLALRLLKPTACARILCPNFTPVAVIFPQALANLLPDVCALFCVMGFILAFVPVEKVNQNQMEITLEGFF